MPRGFRGRTRVDVQMVLFLLALVVLTLGGALCLFTAPSSRRASAVGGGSAILGCVLGLVSVGRVWVSGVPASVRLNWAVPGGAFSLEIDALSGFFLVAILGLSALAAWYGTEYFRGSETSRSAGSLWFFFNLLIAGMALVVTARNAVLFLMAWEIMSLASFFLVTRESEREEVRSAGWTYLVATHLGTLFLFLFFCLLGRECGTLEFGGFHLAAAGAFPISVLFALALVGFGTKAGLMPFHVWLPEAHPAAPSPVSALMSGVMIKTGIYGLVRMLTWFDHPPASWGVLLIVLGFTSGILGVLFALAQHDLKRLLAYHSVENIGIIVMGLGVGLLGRALHSPTLTVLGIAGGLLHVINHAVFKGLLFLGAGSVLHATGTGSMDRLGGLQKRMPWTSFSFLIGAAAISGLPPFNGFISEFLIYLAGLHGVCSFGADVAIALLLVIGGLALIGGLAAACFAKAFGIVFLGEPRGDAAGRAHEAGWSMRLPMLLLATACLGIGQAAPWIVIAMRRVVQAVVTLPDAEIVLVLETTLLPLKYIVQGCGFFILLLLFLAWLRSWLLLGRPVEETVTWDCGYAAPASRMQYTSSSFAEPLTRFFAFFLRPHVRRPRIGGLFAEPSDFHSHTPDWFHDAMFRPVFQTVGRVLSSLRRLQEGRVQVYILYIVVTLLLLLLWCVR